MNTTEYNISVPSDNQFKLVQGNTSNHLKVFANKYYVYVYVNITGTLGTLNTWVDAGLVIDNDLYRPPNTIGATPSNQKSNISLRINFGDGKIQYQNNGSALASGSSTLAIFFYPRKSAMI